MQVHEFAMAKIEWSFEMGNYISTYLWARTAGKKTEAGKKT